MSNERAACLRLVQHAHQKLHVAMTYRLSARSLTRPTAESTYHIAGQIRNGLSQSDLDHHGGQLALDNSGRLNLSGNPGLIASLKDDLKAIAGKPVIIPIYRSVSEDGSKANFEIVKFVAVRIVAVNLTGGSKHVSIQPAKLTFKGVIQASQGSYGTSVDIYSPPMLVQ